MHKALASKGILFAMASSCAFASPETKPIVSERLPRTNLMVYHSPTGGVAQVKSLADWQQRRAEILRGMQEIMGPLPGDEKRCPLDVKTEAKTLLDNYAQLSISYSSEPGSRVPAFLLIPKTVLDSGRQAPAILALHSTDARYGNRVLVEDFNERYRAFARDLVRRGYIVLAPAYPHLANYAPDLKSLGYKSGTMKAIWDNIRGIDVLESMPQVERSRIGALGHSLGGHNAIYTAVFDQRIKAIVSSCGFDSYLHYMKGNIAGWTSERYMPELLQYKDRLSDIPFDFHELLGALAPRPIFINAPLNDANFQSRSVDEIVAAAKPVYRLHGAEDRLIVEHPDCAHDFPAEMREKAYRFLDAALLRQENPQIRSK